MAFPPPPFRPPHISADALNDVVQEVKRVGKISADHTIDVENDHNGIRLRVNPSVIQGEVTGYSGVRPIVRCIDCIDGAIVYTTEFLVFLNGILIDVTATPPPDDYGPPVDETEGHAPDGPGGPWFDSFGCDTETPPA